MQQPQFVHADTAHKAQGTGRDRSNHSERIANSSFQCHAVLSGTKSAQQAWIQVQLLTKLWCTVWLALIGAHAWHIYQASWQLETCQSEHIYDVGGLFKTILCCREENGKKVRYLKKTGEVLPPLLPQKKTSE